MNAVQHRILTRPDPSSLPTRLPERKIRVALVDDHPVFRTGLKHLLELEADMAVVREGKNGADALDIAAAGEVDALVLDVSMPGLSGLEALREVRKIAPALRILAVSGYAEEHYGKQMIQRGADGYVNKGRDPEELVAALRCILTGQRYIVPTVAAQFAAEWVQGDTTPHGRLSEREYEVLVKLASGLSLQATAQGLRLSPKSVSLHRGLLLKKLGLSTNVDLTYFALKNDLLRFEHPFR